MTGTVQQSLGAYHGCSTFLVAFMLQNVITAVCS